MIIKFRQPTPPNEREIKEYNSLYGGQVLGNQLLSSELYKSSYQASLITRAGGTQSGKTVDAQDVVQNATYLTCIALLSRIISQLPLKVMYKTKEGKLIDPIYNKVEKKYEKIARKVNSLLRKPNNFNMCSDFLTQIVLHYSVFGEAFIYAKRVDDSDINSEIIELTALDPTLVYTNITDTQYPSYTVSTPNSKVHNTFSYFNVIHIMELPWHGATSFQKFGLAAELVALDSSIDVLANFYMVNAPKMSTLIMPADDSNDDLRSAKVSETKWKEALSSLKDGFAQIEARRFNDNKSGQAGGLVALPMNLKIERMPLPDIQNADLSTLKAQTTARIAALVGVPVQMLGISDAKFNNVSELTNEVYRSTLYPIILKIEQHLTEQLLRQYSDELYIYADTTTFLGGSKKDQLTYAVSGVSGGIFTANEARAFLGMEAIEGEENDKLKSMGQSQNSTDMDITSKQNTSPQSTGGGGGSDIGTPKINIGQSDANN